MAGPARAQRAVAIHRVARRQRLLLTTRQLEALGLSEEGRRNAVRYGDLVRRCRGVYALPGAGSGWEDDVLTAVMAAGPGAVASHDTARRLWFPTGPTTAPPGSSTASGDAIELTARRRIDRPGVRAHCRPLPAAEVTTRANIPVTTASRTLLDLATRLDADRLGVLVDEALRDRVVTLRELERVAAALPTAAGRARQGAPALQAAVDERRTSTGPGANPWEERMDRAWDRMGLPQAMRQHWIDTPHGRYCVDRAIVELQIAVEWSGYEYHGRRSRFDRDSDRRGHLVEAGWLVLDFTSRSTPAHICRTVLAAVAQRRRERGRAGGGKVPPAASGAAGS